MNGVVVGCKGADARTTGMGILTGRAFRGRIEVLAYQRTPSAIAGLEVGYLRLAPTGEELGRIRHK